MTARSFRLVFGLVLKLFALETDYSRVVSLLREPKTLSCARVWLKKKTECYALCFSQSFHRSLCICRSSKTSPSVHNRGHHTSFETSLRSSSKDFDCPEILVVAQILEEPLVA